MALISTRTLQELIDWLKGSGPPLDLVLQSSPAIQRFVFKEEVIGEAGCCGCSSGNYQPALLLPSAPTGYTIKDAVYEALAIYLEVDLGPFGGVDRFVLEMLSLPHKNKAKQGVPFPDVPRQLPRFALLMQKAQESATMRSHVLAVLWMLLPLNLDLRTTHDKKR